MKNNFGLFFTGVGIGIFLGLSESPILLQILIPVLTIIVGLLSILTGQKNDEKPSESENSLLGKKNISPFPIMWMVLGMVGGSFLGLLAKNYDITGQGSTFGNKVGYDRRLEMDSLQAELNLLKIKSEILIIEKQYQYISNMKIDNSQQAITYDQSLAIAKNVESKKNSNSESNDPLKTNTFLKNTESNNSSEPIHICKLYELCDIKATELVEVLSKSTNEYVQDLLKSHSNDPESLKIEINKYCNCK